MEIITSWDDGDGLDIRLAELLCKYRLPGIFYISNRTNELNKSDIYFLSRIQQVGGHTTTHPEDIKLLHGDELANDIETNKVWLENIIRKPIFSFCYPSGKYNEETIEAVKKAGFTEARTTQRLNIEKPTDMYRIAPTIHVRPDKYDGRNWLEVAKEQFNLAKSKDSYYHIWGHSWEVDEFKMWGELEELFKYIHEHRN